MANEFNRVYSQALAGSPNHAGLPDTLARLVAAQSQHETGNYTSNVYKQSNNGFGYDYNADSPYQVGSYEQYAAYGSLEDSTKEIVDYIYRRVNDGSFPSDLSTITTPEQYASLLKNAGPGAYYGDTLANYANGIASFFNKDVFQAVEGYASANPNKSLLILIGLGLAVWFILKS